MTDATFSKINKDQLIEDIANKLVDNADMKTLIAMYYDDQVGYMSSMNKDELLEWANDYLDLNESEVTEEYANE